MSRTFSRQRVRRLVSFFLVSACMRESACRPVTKMLYGERALYADTDSMGAPVVLVREVRSRARATLVEGSAAVMSDRQPGVMFTLNDSGNDPYLFAIDTLGADRGA
jgi:hypothetical protein